MTQLHAEIELRRPVISMFSKNVDWKIRDDVNVFFDYERHNFLLPTSSNIKEDVKEYVIKNRTCQRIILLVPLFRMTKEEYYKVVKEVLYAGNEVLKEDISITELVVACDNNEDRQLILRKAACYVWGECQDEDLLSPELQLPTPEKSISTQSSQHFPHSPYTPPTSIPSFTPPSLTKNRKEPLRFH